MADTTLECTVLEAVPKGLFVAGQWRDAQGAGVLAVEDPATGEVLVEVADGSAADAMDALAAASGAQSLWAATAPRMRGEILRRTYEALTDQAD